MALNRREFIGSMVASASLRDLALPQLPEMSTSTAAQGKWVENGIISAGGTHEPYMFIVRRGGQRTDTRQISEYEQSEQLIKQLQSLGFWNGG